VPPLSDREGPSCHALSHTAKSVAGGRSTRRRPGNPAGSAEVLQCQCKGQKRPAAHTGGGRVCLPSAALAESPSPRRDGSHHCRRRPPHPRRPGGFNVIVRLGLPQMSTCFAGSTTRKDPGALKVAPEHHGAGIRRATGSGGRHRRGVRRLCPAARGHDRRDRKQVRDEHGECERPPGLLGTVTSSSRNSGPDSLFQPGLPGARRSTRRPASAPRSASTPASGLSVAGDAA
jgi:hypothetical protein